MRYLRLDCYENLDREPERQGSAVVRRPRRTERGVLCPRSDELEKKNAKIRVAYALDAITTRYPGQPARTHDTLN
ncbi:hypothetical protein EVAR_18367_1 [Eumeta japonica]|uniref:Uncharacterized protein n=1 Tax=Eumeta variegata TaxID=151549 RepID=A0A4C1UTX1_EUMVA|nr:hypothetical protein EVAR_18367_1 [Eumeta japonica]